ncbi:MAG: TetR/AcrR family transcriptional regulator [Actinobacteria bacterium]|nr:TetR/AcrR family transcriptional regulator [Actinomycetota bacterium]
MPKLWRDTIAAHRREVRDAVLDATARLAGQHGVLNVTMSQIAEDVGIGRATLYKYFASVEEILQTWHERQISDHLQLLTEIAERDAPQEARLVEVLGAYAQIQRQRTDHAAHPHGSELAALLHHDAQVAPAERRLRDLVGALLADAAAAGAVRDDVPPDELASFCLHALGAAASTTSDAAVQRLVRLTLEGLQRPRQDPATAGT